MSTVLEESFFPVPMDSTYRRQGRHIIIAQVESVVPVGAVVDPDIWGGGSSDFTWGRVQKFFARSPLARHGQMPMHFYAEFLEEDYVTYVGCPLTNTSWFLQAAVAARVLPVQYMDAVLIVLQENYGIEAVEQRLWRLLSHSLITPLMRMLEMPRSRVVFFETIADQTAVRSPDWRFRFRDPRYLDPVILDMFIKDYEKR